MIVLVIEDNPIDRMRIVAQIKSAEMDVKEVRSGEEARGYLKNNFADIVLLSIRLPGIDGIEVLHWIRNSVALNETLVFALTAVDMDGDLDRYLAVGFNGYISKSSTLLSKQLNDHRVRERTIDNDVKHKVDSKHATKEHDRALRQIDASTNEKPINDSFLSIINELRQKKSESQYSSLKDDNKWILASARPSIFDMTPQEIETKSIEELNVAVESCLEMIKLRRIRYPFFPSSDDSTQLMLDEKHQEGEQFFDMLSDTRK